MNLFRCAAANLFFVLAVGAGSIGFLAAQALTAPAFASCKMNISVSHNPNQVQAHIINGCGDRVRAVGDWNGKRRYGTYMLQNYSTACDEPGPCQHHPDGTLRHGGWQDRRTGKYHQTF